MKLILKVFASFLVAIVTISPANASPYFASEVIEDVLRLDLFSRNLEKTFTDSTGTTVTSSDASIIASNNVDNDFGIYNFESVGYRHNLTGLTPPAGNFLTAILTISAYGADRSNDSVVTETINLGNIVGDGSLFGEGFTTSIFNLGTSATLNALFSDGYLNIVVNKSPLDAFSVYKSQLDVHYEAVPEPATMLLLGSGVFGLIARRRMTV
jgi:hypothetical protein